MAQSTGSINRVFQARFRPDSTNKFVTIGIRHIKFWSLAGAKLLVKRATMSVRGGASYKLQTMLSLAFAPVS